MNRKLCVILSHLERTRILLFHRLAHVTTEEKSGMRQVGSIQGEYDHCAIQHVCRNLVSLSSTDSRKLTEVNLSGDDSPIPAVRELNCAIDCTIK